MRLAGMSSRELGSVLSGYREAAQLSQRDVARRMGVALGTVRNWECGSRRPSLDMLDSYLRIVGARIMIGATR